MKSYIPEYPRPQFVRPDWENLNGEWNFAFDDEKKGVQAGWTEGVPAVQTIRVPYTYETKAGGIGDESVHQCVWYSRQVELSREQLDNKRVLLHFEGSDYITTLWVNGIHIGQHVGGYARFTFDITHAVKENKNTIVVRVEDSLNPQQPRGKQRWVHNNFGCWYVQTTGIWKTVWMEFVPHNYISSVKMTPFLREGTVEVELDLEAENFEGLAVEAVVSFADRTITQSRVHAFKDKIRMVLDVKNMSETEWGVYTWSPENPNLYDIEFRLWYKEELIDKALSYFGMREIRIDGQNILLNGAPVYQRLILDQGYWKDTHLTPPDEKALVKDIERMLELGYNGVRKHQKIEDERFLYWCDVKGLMVWCEMPSAYEFGDEAVNAFMAQWSEVVLQNYNHPCIITWTPVNESWGVPEIKTNTRQQNFTQAIYYLTKSLDPYRPVIVNDGWDHTISDIITLHDYEEDGDVFFERYSQYINEILESKLYHNFHRTAFADGFKYRGQPIIISEYGGIAYNNDDSGWGYGKKVNTEEEFIERFEKITTAIKKLPYCCGFCYTQLTDVQQEINGLMDIDRNYKVDAEKINEINTRSVSCLYK